MSLEDKLHGLLGSYVGSPQWIKYSVGKIYSYLPQSVRHGKAYGQFVRELGVREPEAIRIQARAKLLETLAWAADTVPAYRDYVGELREADIEEAITKFPITDKLDIKANTGHYLSKRMPASTRLSMFTGGSTSNPMHFYLHKGVSRPKETAYINDFNARAGISSNDVILNLRGRTVPGAGMPGKNLWMYEPIRRHLILSSDHLEQEYMPQYVAALRQWQPKFIQAFPSAIYPLARWFAEHPAPDITGLIRCIQLTSENVYDYQMKLLREVFDCPVLVGYGHTERVLLASSMTDDDRYFFWPLYGYLELVDAKGQRIAESGVMGEIVGTSFDNKVMPFVRYRTGDFGVWSDKPPHPLLPGYPVLERIEGRLQEFVVGSDHRLISITTLGAAHFTQLAVVESIQYEQHEPGILTLKVVAARELTASESANIGRAIYEKTQGSCSVRVERVSEIKRTEHGKHKLMLQHIDIRNYLGASALD